MGEKSFVRSFANASPHHLQSVNIKFAYSCFSNKRKGLEMAQAYKK